MLVSVSCCQCVDVHVFLSVCCCQCGLLLVCYCKYFRQCGAGSFTSLCCCQYVSVSVLCVFAVSSILLTPIRGIKGHDCASSVVAAGAAPFG